MSEYIVELDGNALRVLALTEGVRGEIVRCRDCESFRAGDADFPATCSKWYPAGVEHVEPCGFCAWGERREP